MGLARAMLLLAAASLIAEGGRGRFLQRQREGRQEPAAPPTSLADSPNLGALKATAVAAQGAVTQVFSGAAGGAGEQTAYPPPAPQLDHPFDTILGYSLVSLFLDKPTVKPPHNLSVPDLSFGCPMLVEWPTELEVVLPDPCGGDGAAPGLWRSAGTDVLMQWSVDQSFFDWNPAPRVTYSMPSGVHFGTSQKKVTLITTVLMLKDCEHNIRYTIDELVYKQMGDPDPASCQRYGSCDGIVWLQYQIRDQGGFVVAKTHNLKLFQDSFIIYDSDGVEIAVATREGDWSPISTACPRIWKVTFASGTPGIFSRPTSQWPIAEMVTMMAMRDSTRRPDGLVRATPLEYWKWFTLVVMLILFACCCVCVPCCIWIFCSGPLHYYIDELEKRCCPKRMARPEKYEH